jgi:PST family polysaccharide transporter
MTKLKNIINLDDKKVLLSNFFSLTILQIFTYILPLLTLPYLVRVLGVEKFGLVVFAQAFIIFFNLFVDFGFNLSAVKEVSIYRDNKDKLTEIFSSVMIIKFILSIISLIILTIIVFSFDKFSSDKGLYYLTFLWVIGQAMFPIWYFQGIEKMKYITIVNIISKIIFTILIFVVIQTPDDYIYVPLLNGLGFIVGGILSLWIIYKNFNQSFELQEINILIKYFKESSQFFLSRVSVVIYTSANAFVLGLFTNNIMVGYYSIAEQLYKAIQGFYQPISQVLYPYIAKERNIALFKKLFTLIVFVNIIGIIILYFIDSYIFDFLFTKHLGSESIQVFHILLISSLVVVPSILLGYPFLGALGFAKYANMSVIYGSIFHLSGLGILSIINSITIYSVAIMVIFTELSVLSSRIYWSKRNLLWQK